MSASFLIPFASNISLPSEREGHDEIVMKPGSRSRWNLALERADGDQQDRQFDDEEAEEGRPDDEEQKQAMAFIRAAYLKNLQVGQADPQASATTASDKQATTTKKEDGQNYPERNIDLISHNYLRICEGSRSI